MNSKELNFMNSFEGLRNYIQVTHLQLTHFGHLDN